MGDELGVDNYAVHYEVTKRPLRVRKIGKVC